jgi:hypothetical protein
VGMCVCGVKGVQACMCVSCTCCSEHSACQCSHSHP